MNQNMQHREKYVVLREHLREYICIPLCLIVQLVRHLPEVSGVLGFNPNDENSDFVFSHPMFDETENR